MDGGPGRGWYGSPWNQTGHVGRSLDAGVVARLSSLCRIAPSSGKLGNHNTYWYVQVELHPMKVGSPKPAEDGFGSVGAMSQDVERQILHLGHFLGDMGWWGGYRQQTGAEPALEVPSVSQEYGMEGTDSTSFDPVNCTADTGDDLVRGGDPACFRDAIDPAAAGGDAVEEEQVLMEGLEGQGMNEVISGVTDEEWIRTNPQMQRRTPRIDPLTQSDIGERKMVAGLKLVETSKFSNELPSTAWAPEIRRAAHVDDGASFARFRGRRIDLDVNAPRLPFSPTCEGVRGAGNGSSSFYGTRGSSCAVGGSSVQDLDAFGHFAEAQVSICPFLDCGHQRLTWGCSARSLQHQGATIRRAGRRLQERPRTQWIKNCVERVKKSPIWTQEHNLFSPSPRRCTRLEA